MNPPSAVGSETIARAAGCSTFKVRRCVRDGRIPAPDLLQTERAWLWTPQAAQVAIAALRENRRGKRHPGNGQPPVMSGREAADLLGVRYSRLLDLLSAGLLPSAARDKGRWLLTAADVRELREKITGQ